MATSHDAGARAAADPTRAAALCIEGGADDNLQSFSRCWVARMMSDDQRRMADCIAGNMTTAAAVFCVAGRPLSPADLRIANCAAKTGGDMHAIAGCSGLRVVPLKSQRIAACVVANPKNVWGAALCAGGRDLAPAQAVFANCAMTTSLQPHAMARCIGGAVTANELRKCLLVGVGGDGCFGDNAAVTLIARDAWRGVGDAPTAVLAQPGQLFGGSNSVFNEPNQLAGRPN
jgi:hypothetical protein